MEYFLAPRKKDEHINKMQILMESVFPFNFLPENLARPAKGIIKIKNSSTNDNNTETGRI